MDRLTTAIINSRKFTFNYSVSVMFDVAEKYGGAKEVLDVVSLNTKEGFEALKWLAVKMATDGELCRRAQGFDAEPMIKDDDINLHTISPYDYEELRRAVVNAITAGYRRSEADPNEEIDLGLAELQSKKKRRKGEA